MNSLPTNNIILSSTISQGKFVHHSSSPVGLANGRSSSPVASQIANRKSPVVGGNSPVKRRGITFGSLITLTPNLPMDNRVSSSPLVDNTDSVEEDKIDYSITGSAYYPAAGWDVETVFEMMEKFPNISQFILADIDSKRSRIFRQELKKAGIKAKVTRYGMDLHITFNYGKSKSRKIIQYLIRDVTDETDEFAGQSLVIVRHPGDLMILSATIEFYVEVIKSLKVGGYLFVKSAVLPSRIPEKIGLKGIMRKDKEDKEISDISVVAGIDKEDKQISPFAMYWVIYEKIQDLSREELEEAMKEEGRIAWRNSYLSFEARRLVEDHRQKLRKIHRDPEATSSPINSDFISSKKKVPSSYKRYSSPLARIGVRNFINFMLISILLSSSVNLYAQEPIGVYYAQGSRIIVPFGKSYNYADILVKRVIDGDTLRLESGERVRLIGIDAPEMHESKKLYRDAQRTQQDVATIKKLGKRAYEFTKNLVEGKRVRLEFDVEKYDRYGRLLAYVYLEDGRLVNAEIIKEGFASLMTIPPNVKYADEFLKWYREARENKRGLWR